MDKHIGKNEHVDNRKREKNEEENISNDESKNMDEDDQLFPEYERKTGFRRYENSLKNLLPFRSKGKDTGTMSIDNAGLLSAICFSWLSDIMYKAYRKRLTIEELPSLSPCDIGIRNAKRLELLWKDELAERGPEKASFFNVAWKFCRTRVLASWLIYTSSLISGFLSYTFLMRKLLENVESETGSYSEGIMWTSLLIIAEMSRTLFLAWAWSLNYRTGLRLRSACMTLLYKKIIRVNNLESKNIGKVINMFSNDAQRIFELLVIGPMIIGAPISTAFGIFYILSLLGPMALLGMIAFFLFFPIQYMISRLAEYLQTKTVKISDMRIRLMNEILDCIKLIKMYAWEKRFSEDLLRIRNAERRLLLKSSYCRAFSDCIAPTVPVISATITFLAHIYGGNNLTAAQVFPYMTFLDAGIRLSLFFFQDGVYALIGANISFKRLKNLFLLDDGNCFISKPIVKSQALAITNGTFAYNTFVDDDKESSQANDKNQKDNHASEEEENEEEELNPTLNVKYVDTIFDISFEAPKGHLIGICGLVGSGKSTLLLAALGQLRVSNGQVMRDGTCAYVSQQAWITNATLRENILFGEKFDRSRYNDAIYACSLSQDIAMMPGGDQTEIGEKGVNLSGGQKQRVALARALYADRDIYFLDDPLSAVDSRVGSHIFDNLILGALKGKTVIFVTHQIQYLNRCDDIYMMRDGRIIEHGSHDELMKLDNEYSSMVAAISTHKETEDESIVDQEIESFPQSVDDPLHHATRSRTASVISCRSSKSVERSNILDAQLTVAEDIQQGSIKAHTYHSYIMAAGGYLVGSIVILSFFAEVSSTIFSSWWLAYWIKARGGNTTIVRNNETIISDNINDNPDLSYYQTIYASTIGVILLASALRSLIYTSITIRASTKMHKELFKKIIACSMRFFDTNPSGRIQHLFSRDMDEVDNKLPSTVASIMENVISIFFSILVICGVLPWFILPLCVLAVLYYFVSKIFRITIRDLKRMDNKSRAPVISFVTATVQGLSTIHAFGKENDFMKKFNNFFDDNSKCLFLYTGAMRWLAVRIDALSVAITGITAFLVIALRTQVSPSLAGLALAYSAQFSDTFQYTLRILTDAEIRFISVERISHYIRTLRGEGSAKQSTVKPESSWPTAAEIKFNNVSMSYGDESPFILKNLSLTIDAGEKIGIVGRTGAGKSSLTVALFRLVELKEGKIEIDDVDISQISLSQLRSKLSIIPQDPILFSGTVRSNLDPFKLYTDAEIWEALDKTELKGRVQSITGQLDASVGFGGDNLSLGERQLLCLARALLRNSKILVLDEATAAVDPETEIVVQKTVQQAFSNCTILTIAHRLQTVLPLHRVLVMDGGRVLEFDTPSNLLGNPNSEFSKMMAAAEQAEHRSRTISINGA